MAFQPLLAKFSTKTLSDVILGTYTGSVFSPAPAASPFTSTSTSVTITTNIPESTFFQGIFSIDGGTTWQDFNAQAPNLSTPGFAVLQTQMMYGRSDPGVITLTAENWSYYNGSTTTSASYTFQYKVVLYARTNQSDVTAQPVGQKATFNTANNYQKIFGEIRTPISIPVGTGNIVLNHNLGYVPRIRSFIENFSYAGNSSLYEFGYWTSEFTLFGNYIDNTSSTYFFDNSTGGGPMTATLYARVYYDS